MYFTIIEKYVCRARAVSAHPLLVSGGEWLLIYETKGTSEQIPEREHSSFDEDPIRSLKRLTRTTTTAAPTGTPVNNGHGREYDRKRMDQLG